MTTKEPSDLANLIKRLDPTALTEQYKELFGKLNLPNLDTNRIFPHQDRRNSLPALGWMFGDN